MKTIVQTAAIVIVSVWLLLASAPANAKGIIFYSTGEQLYDVGDFPPSIDEPIIKEANLKVGLKCSHFGLFWANVWTWNCEFVGTPGADSRSVYQLPENIKQQVQATYKKSDAKRGIWNRFGILITGLILLAISFWGSHNTKKEQENAQPAPEIGSDAK